MNLLARILRVHVPRSMKKQMLVALFESTAEAFGTTAPNLRACSFEECLREYALFTAAEVSRRLRAGEDVEEIRRNLHSYANRLGSDLRKRFHLTTRDDILSIGRVLYKSIGIEFHGSATGDVVIRECFFSGFYSGEVCRVMSSLDEGIAAGLSGGGKLTFSQRLSEGHACCKAVLTF